MIMRRKRNISIYIALAAALLLLATETFAGNYGKKQSDIVDTAVTAGTFNTLAAALEAGDLVDTLKADGPYTVFAPSDEAFARLPDGTLEMLLLPENKDKLTAVLTYHVVAGRVYSDQLENGAMPATLQGSPVKVVLEQDAAFINGARVVSADIETTNGVIHVIDKVLLPK